MAQKILQLTGAKSKLIFQPLPQDDPMQRQTDISKAAKLLGFSAKVQLKEGLKKTIEYFRGVV